MADADVRPATPDDASEIARIQLTTWRTAYTELLPAEVLDNLDHAETESQWRNTLRNGPASVMVATEGDWLVGFCAAGRCPEPESADADGGQPADAATVALMSSLLVEPRWGRRGHGGRLFARMGEMLSADGATRGITWAAESDSASMFFFRGIGWAPDGTVRTLDAQGRPIREMRLTGPLEVRWKTQSGE